MRLATPFVTFEPPLTRDELARDTPRIMASPFASGRPHPWAARAVNELMAALEAGWPLGAESFAAPHRGKMFGVLVARDRDGNVGYLKAFSGMLGESWQVPGFSPPVFDEAGRDAFWPAGEKELRAWDLRIEEARRTLDEAEATLAAQRQRDDDERRTLVAHHRARKLARASARADHATLSDDAWAALAAESREDARSLRELKARQAEALGAQELAVERARTAWREARDAQLSLSGELLELLFAGYTFTSARGEMRSLRALFAPKAPPGGAGDCAAPKLFVEARRRGLVPLAVAEFWWGAPPVTGGRRHGHLYPACRGKCGPVLAHLCDGLAVEPPPVYGADVIPPDEPRVLFEDDWLLVVDKPAGLLSVPGRAASLGDSVQTRLRQRFPAHPALTVVHRLDLDTSGLLLVAKDEATYVALQAQFAQRLVEKRYVAWLEGALTAEGGRVELPLRVDLDDRPRQLHDPVAGKPAHTRWQRDVVAGQRTRVWLYPETGRTHQLRVHAAHPAGLGAPIVGDRLYGREDERLFLHAESLTFTHPRSGARLCFESPAPF